MIINFIGFLNKVSNEGNLHVKRLEILNYVRV